MKIQLDKDYNSIISIENLLEAWKEFEKGKKNKKDVQDFSLQLMDNIFRFTKNFSIIPTNTADIKLSRLMIRSREIFIRPKLKTGYCITQFTESFIHFLIKNLFLIHIHVGWTKERIEPSTDFVSLQEKSAKIMPILAGF